MKRVRKQPRTTAIHPNKSPINIEKKYMSLPPKQQRPNKKKKNFKEKFNQTSCT